MLALALDIVLATLSLPSVNALDNGLERTPAMGWNPYNVFLWAIALHSCTSYIDLSLLRRCDTNEAQYHAAAQALAQSGLPNLGYKYFNMSALSHIRRFCFLTPLAAIVGGKGLIAQRMVRSLGTRHVFHLAYRHLPPTCTTLVLISESTATRQSRAVPSFAFVLTSSQWLLLLRFRRRHCWMARQPQSRAVGCRYFCSLGCRLPEGWFYGSYRAAADDNPKPLQYDNCYAVSPTDFVDMNPPISLEPHFTAMRDALNSTGRPIVFSVCEWGVQDPARWAPEVGNSWRISNDIGPPPSWDNLVRIINQVVPITHFASPGAFNDLDLLEVGNDGLTTAEQETHFAFWAAAKLVVYSICHKDIDTNKREFKDHLSSSLPILQQRRKKPCRS